MGIEYSLIFRLLKPDNSVYRGILGGVVSARYSRVLGDVGEIELTVNNSSIDISPDLLEDYKIVVSLSAKKGGVVISSAIDGVFAIKKIVKSIDASGNRTIALSGYDYNLYLKNRVIAYRGESSQAVKSAAVDDAMKAVVNDNLGTLSTVDYDGAAVSARQVLPLTIADDLSAGNNIDITGIEWRGLLEILQEMQAQSVADGKEVFFNCTSAADYSPVFQTRATLWGSDKTDTMVFSPSRRNVQNPSITYDFSAMKTAAYISENGNAASQRIEDYTTTHTIKNDLTRAEMWGSLGRADPNSADTDEQFEAVAYDLLSRNRARISFDGTITSTDSTPYRMNEGAGNYWGLGDRVSVLIDPTDTPITPIIRAIQVTLDNSGAVNVEARVEIIEAI